MRHVIDFDFTIWLPCHHQELLTHGSRASKSRQDGYYSAPESPRSTQSAPWAPGGHKGLVASHISTLLLTTLTSGPNLCMIVAENAAPANNRR